MVNKVTGGRQFRQKLKQAADNLKSGKSLKVGFLEGATYPDGTPVAYIAAINEFGGSANPLASRRFTFAITKKREKSGTALSKPVRVILLRMWLFLSTRSPFHPVLSSVR